MVKCSHTPLRATNQDVVIELDVAPIVNPITVRGTSGWDKMLELKRQDKARSPPIHPGFPPKRTKTSYASKVVENGANKRVEKPDIDMTPKGNQLRFHLSYKASKDCKTDRAINEEKKNIMTTILNVCEEIDHSAKLVKWDKSNNHVDTGVSRSDMFLFESINSPLYIDATSSGSHDMTVNQTIFRVGVRIQTSWKLTEFHDAWKNSKRACEFGKKKWMVIFPAESQ